MTRLQNLTSSTVETRVGIYFAPPRYGASTRIASRSDVNEDTEDDHCQRNSRVKIPPNYASFVSRQNQLQPSNTTFIPTPPIEPFQKVVLDLFPSLSCTWNALHFIPFPRHSPNRPRFSRDVDAFHHKNNHPHPQPSARPIPWITSRQ